MAISDLNQGNLLYTLNNQVQMPPKPASVSDNNSIFEQKSEKTQNSVKTPLVIGTIALAALGCYLGRGKIKKFLGFARENASKPNVPKPTPHSEPVPQAPKPEKPPVSPKSAEKTVKTVQKLENGNQIEINKFPSGEIETVLKNSDGLVLEEVFKASDGEVILKINREYNGKVLAKKISVSKRVKTVTTYGENGAYVCEVTDAAGKSLLFEELTPQKFTSKRYKNGKTEVFVSEFSNPSTVSTTRTVIDANGNLWGDDLTLVTKYNSEKCIISTSEELYHSGELVATKTYKPAPNATDTFAVLTGKQIVMEKGFENQAEKVEKAFEIFQDMRVSDRFRLNLH